MLFRSYPDGSERKGYSKDYIRSFSAVLWFKGCSHISEPDCGVKEALAEGKISPLRYENYKLLYEELKDVKKY